MLPYSCVGTFLVLLLVPSHFFCFVLRRVIPGTVVRTESFRIVRVRLYRAVELVRFVRNNATILLRRYILM